MENQPSQIIGESINFLMLLPSFFRKVGVPAWFVVILRTILRMIAVRFRTMGSAVEEWISSRTTRGTLHELFRRPLDPADIADGKVLLEKI